jgi:capsid assembly protease
MSDRIPDTLLAEAIRRPWMITEDGLALVMSVITRTNMTPEAIALREGDPLPRRTSTLRPDGTLMLPVLGPIVRRADLFSKMSGATDVSGLRDELATALDMNAVQRIMLVFDSPGGEVVGITELARMIRAADAVKPVYAYVEGTAASAAYYLAAAAREITGSPMSVTGSIGVRMAITKKSATPGATTFEFVSSQSPNKNASPETDAGRAQIQQMMDDLAAVFLEDVGAFRGLSADQVAEHYGAGGVFAASRALEMGLIDRIETQDEMLDRIAAMPPQPAGRAGTSRVRAVATPSGQESSMKTTEKPAATAAADAPPVVSQEQMITVAESERLVAADRTRITQLLRVGRVTLSDSISTAITAGTSAADFALEQALAAVAEPTPVVTPDAPKGNQDWQNKRAADENALQAAGVALPNAGAADVEVASEAAVIARITSAHAQITGGK